MSQHTYAICKNKCLIPLDGEITGINVPVSGWEAIEGGFTNTVAVADLKEDNFPVYMDLDWDACVGDLSTLVKNKGLLSRFTYTDGQMVLYATKKPAIDLVVRLTGVGVSSEVNA